MRTFAVTFDYLCPFARNLNEFVVAGLQAGVAVRDHDPEVFLDVHGELFAARHDRGEDIKDREIVSKALAAGGADPDAILAIVDTGRLLSIVKAEHDDNVTSHEVWGVPTIIAGDRAVFLRLLDRPSDGPAAIDRIERLVDLVASFPELHEFKQVDLPV